MTTMTVDFTTPGFVHPGPSADEQFFYDFAGWGYDPKTETPEQGRWRGAYALRRAELHAERVGWTMDWEEDDDPITEEGHPQWIAFLRDEANDVIDSLGSIDLGEDGSPWSDADPYVRVVAAELAHSAMIEAARS